MKEGGQTDRRILYLDQLNDKLIHLEGLDEEAWYYVCVEFENMHRMHRAGNTSTTCKRYRTLDKFGKTAENFLGDVQISAVRENSLEFIIVVNSDFPVQFDVFLDPGFNPGSHSGSSGGSNPGSISGSAAVQTFFVDKPKQIFIKFSDLLPGLNYGRLCVQEKPLRVPFTAMGRPIFGATTKCFFNDLKTEIPIQIDPNSINSNSNHVRSLPVTGSGAKIRQNFSFAIFFSIFFRFF